MRLLNETLAVQSEGVEGDQGETLVSLSHGRWHGQLKTKACKPTGVSLAPLSPRPLASTRLGFEAPRLLWNRRVCLTGEV